VSGLLGGHFQVLVVVISAKVSAGGSSGRRKNGNEYLSLIAFDLEKVKVGRERKRPLSSEGANEQVTL